MITKRRTEIKDPSFKHKGDFLTLLIEDEVFKDQDTYILDECITFMLASTITTTLLITNSIYYFTKHPEILKKMRDEFTSLTGLPSF